MRQAASFLWLAGEPAQTVSCGQDLSSRGIQEHKEKARGSFDDGCAQFKCSTSKIGLLCRKRIMVLPTKAIQGYAW